MSTVAVTASSLKDTIANNDTVLLDFWASWCGPCKTFGPVYEDVSNDNPDLVFAKIDTEAEPELAAQFHITSIPTLMVIREGVVLFSQPGALAKPTLEQLVAKVREVDMSDVHSQVATQGQQ